MGYGSVRGKRPLQKTQEFLTNLVESVINIVTPYLFNHRHLFIFENVMTNFAIQLVDEMSLFDGRY